jgi:hypothetical protein
MVSTGKSYVTGFRSPYGWADVSALIGGGAVPTAAQAFAALAFLTACAKARCAAGAGATGIGSPLRSVVSAYPGQAEAPPSFGVGFGFRRCSARAASRKQGGSGGGAGNRTREEKAADRPEIAPDRAYEAESESPRIHTVRDHSGPFETARGAEPTNGELERAIVDAVTMGAVDVARTLAARLEARRRADNVIDLEGERRRRQ